MPSYCTMSATRFDNTPMFNKAYEAVQSESPFERFGSHANVWTRELTPEFKRSVDQMLNEIRERVAKEQARKQRLSNFRDSVMKQKSNNKRRHKSQARKQAKRRAQKAKK